MSQIDPKTDLSEDTAEGSTVRSPVDRKMGFENIDDDSNRLVPVAESIRYRKRAQSAERNVELLTEQLAQTQSHNVELAEHLNTLQIEQQLTHKLAEAGALDLETAVLIAKAKVQENDNTDLNVVVRQLQKEKQYLFGGTAHMITAKKTATAKQRNANGRTILQTAASRAATSGSRRDLQRYLKLRRNIV